MGGGAKLLLLIAVTPMGPSVHVDRPPGHIYRRFQRWLIPNRHEERAQLEAGPICIADSIARHLYVMSLREAVTAMLTSAPIHPRKRERPFGCGAFPIALGMILAAIRLLVAFAIAIALSPSFAAMLLAYFLVTCLYSL